MQSINTRQADHPRLYSVRTGHHAVPYGAFGLFTWQNAGRVNPRPPTGPGRSADPSQPDSSGHFRTVIFL